jgi:hypothetical protein
MKLIAHHGERYFLFEVEFGDEGDPWRPYGRVYDRVAGVVFNPVSFRRLNDAGDWFQEWQGTEDERRVIENEAAAAAG